MLPVLFAACGAVAAACDGIAADAVVAACVVVVTAALVNAAYHGLLDALPLLHVVLLLHMDARLHGSPLYVIVFPPFPLISAVPDKLWLEPVDASLILPSFMRCWSAMLSQLPIKAVHELSYHASLYTIG